MIANSEKKKMKISYPILVSPTNFLKKFLSLRDFILPLQKGVGDGNMEHVILLNSFYVFLLEHVFDVFRMFLLLPAIKNKTIIQNKTEDRQSVTSFN